MRSGIVHMKPLTEICGPAVLEDDADWLEQNYPNLHREVQQAVNEGHDPHKIYLRYYDLAANRDALWLRVEHAAQWMKMGKGE